MAGWAEGPVCDQGAALVVSLDLYGPQAETIQAMIDQCDALTDDQLRAMAQAFEERRRMTDDAAWRAAETAGKDRVTQAGKAAWDIEISIKSNGFDRDPSVVRSCAWAANDAGLAVSTRDLIGTAGYFVWDYDKLMYPWRVGAGDPS
jgi:hypothetical protein